MSFGIKFYREFPMRAFALLSIIKLLFPSPAQR